jgi:hypothetical protein
MRKLALILTAATAIVSTCAWSPAQADPRDPGYRGRVLLQFGNTRELYAAGCLEWSFQNQIWYDKCRWQRRGPVVTARY